MAQQHFQANREIEMVLLALQLFQVLFLWVHDWIPLGRLNDVAAVRGQDTTRRLVTVTLIQSVPWTIGLCFSLLDLRRPYPEWLYGWLVISYGLLFIGQIRACGYLIFSDRNQSELLAIKSCSAKRIPSYRRAMEWSQTLRISCFIWRPHTTLIVLLMK
jgi:hypothetical protein